MNGEEFLNKLYRDLNLSDEVLHTSNGAKDKDEAVHRYMERLERTHSKAVNKHKLDLLKSFYYKKYIVKEIDIPRYRNKERIINAQKDSLDSWLNYLLDENARYPMWAKYWAFQGMLKIGNYNETTGTYQKRSKKTLAPFIEVNPEVLARCISMVVDYVEKKELTDDELSKLVESGNFQKLYTMLQKDYRNNLSNLGNDEDGIWITYHYETSEEVDRKEDEGIEPEYLKLYNSLQGYNTGWCTAGSVETAKEQICGGEGYEGGDFHVYYTKDKNNEYKIPRIAIRMDGKDRIGEIRGVSDGQNLEEGLEEVLEARLDKFKNIDEYIIANNLKKVSNMRQLTLLKKKIFRKEQFTDDDIKFIYELDEDIYGFGWESDPRIEEIINTRNILNDFLSLSDIEDKREMFEKFEDDIIYVLDNEKMKFNDEKLILELADIDGIFFEYANYELMKDREFVLKAVKENGLSLEYASDELREDKEIVLEAVMENGLSLKYANHKLRGDKEIVLEAVIEDGLSLEYASHGLSSDRDVVLEAVRRGGNTLKYASKELLKDKEIVLKAVQKNGMLLKYLKSMNEELQYDRDIVLAAVKQDGNALSFVDTELLKDKEIMLAAVMENGLALKYASRELKKDKDVVLAALKQNSQAFQYVSDELKNDCQIVLKLVKEDSKVLRYVKYELLEDEKFMLEAIKQNGDSLAEAGYELRHNQEFALKAIEKNISAFVHVDSLIRNNRIFMFKAVDKNVAVLKYAPEFRRDDSFILTAMKINGLALAYGSKRVRSNKDNVLFAISSDVRVLKYIPSELLQDEKFMLSAVKINGLSLAYASEEIKNKKEIVMEAVKQNGNALKWASITLKKDRDVALEAVKQNINSFKHVDASLKDDNILKLLMVKEGINANKLNNKETVDVQNKKL